MDVLKSEIYSRVIHIYVLGFLKVVLVSRVLIAGVGLYRNDTRALKFENFRQVEFQDLQVVREPRVSLRKLHTVAVVVAVLCRF